MLSMWVKFDQRGLGEKLLNLHSKFLQHDLLQCPQEQSSIFLIMEALVVNEVQIEPVSESPDEADALSGQYLDSHRHALDLQSSILRSLYALDQTFGNTNTADIDVAGRFLTLWHMAY